MTDEVIRQNWRNEKELEEVHREWHKRMDADTQPSPPPDAPRATLTEEAVARLQQHLDSSEENLSVRESQCSRLEAALAEMSKPVTDDEWLGLCAGDHVQIADVQRHEMDAFLSARAAKAPEAA